MDHGLESKADREQMGKTPVGEISVEISKAAQKVFVAFRDDGRGLNRDQILQKAKEKGLLKKPESEYEDSEIYAFLLRPGFTTKASATMFSAIHKQVPFQKKLFLNLLRAFHPPRETP